MTIQGAGTSILSKYIDLNADELAYRLRQQELIADYGRFALNTRDVPSLLQEATRVCADGMASEFCKVLRYIPSENIFLVTAGVGWRPGVVGQATVGADTESPAGYAFHTGAAVISNHLTMETRFRTPKLLEEHGVRRAVNVLIQSDNHRYGVLEVDSSNPGKFEKADLAFMEGFANLIGVAIERQQLDDARLEAEEQLKAALAFQEVLTQEVSHRVKNSLAIVAGLLNMQRRTSSNSEVQSALADAQARLQTIGQIHDRLWRNHEVRSVALAPFIREFCVHLQTSAGEHHSFECLVHDIDLSTGQAVPLALLINELVTNALKYAYGPGAGTVEVSIEALGDDRLHLAVADRGKGYNAPIAQKPSSGFGMKLIERLGIQLGVKAAWEDNQPGTRYVLDFPILK